MLSSNSKILFVINPISGTKSKIDWEPTIRKFFLNHSMPFDFFLLDGKDDADRKSVV